MSDYSEVCLRTFLKEQKKLFAEPVAETLEEAEAFLGELKETEPDGGACIAGRALPKGEKLIYLK